MTLDELHRALGGEIRKNNHGKPQLLCPGPGHSRTDRSLSIEIDRTAPDGFVVHSFAGDDWQECKDYVRHTIGAPAFEAKPNGSTPASGSKPHLVKTYDYVDENSDLLFQVCRYEPKGFKQRRPNGKGDWIWKLGDVRRVLYRLPELLESLANQHAVFVVEGERDADRLWSLNVPATTCPQGAGKWREEYSPQFAGATVYILQDNDEPGRAHAQQVARSLYAVGAVAYVVELPSHKDASEWLDNGGTVEQLWQLAEQSPRWGPDQIQSNAPREPTNGVFGPCLVTRCAADIEPERIEWLWPGRLARGKHTCIAGEPGTGKSQLAIAITAAVTTRGEWPCDEGRAPLGNVIILSAEDGAADTIIPRLLAAGADRSRVHTVSAVRNLDGSRRALNLERDLDLLEKEIARIGNVVLVVIDPVSSYLGKTDSHKNSEVRGILEPLSEMAERTRVAILSVTHFSKSGANTTTKALHRFIGSIAFTGAPRAAFAVIEDAEQEGRRLFLHAKNNLAPAPKGLAYRLEQRFVGDIDNGIVASRIVWDGQPVTITANQALAAEAAGTETRTVKAEAMEFLRAALADGPLPATELNRMAREHGLTPKTVRSAREGLKVKIDRDGFGPGSKSLWSLP
jgi:hypothetical protein